ncbi:MAG: DUF6801 domain-containing protein [Baekduiaceae bacterium]
MSRSIRRALGGVVASALAVIVAAPAHAGTLTQQYSCQLPLVGGQPAELKITADYPASTGAGQPTQSIDVAGTVTLKGDADVLTRLVKAGRISGVGSVLVTLRTAGIELPFRVPVNLAPAPVPATGSPVLEFTGSMPAFTLPPFAAADGTDSIILVPYTLEVDGLGLNLAFTDAAGGAIVLPSIGGVPDTDGNPATVDVPCTLDPPGQNRVIPPFDDPGDIVPPTRPTDLAATAEETSVALTWTASTDNVGVVGYDVFQDGVLVKTVDRPGTSITGLTPDTVYRFKVRASDAAGALSPFSEEVTARTDAPATATYRFDLAGTSVLKTLTRGSVPLRGTIDPTLDLATGAFTADLSLFRTRARLQVLGVLPVAADIAFTQTDKTRGTLKDGVLAAQARFKVLLPQLYLFGTLPIVSPDTCQTKSSSVAIMRSEPGFDPLRGGRLTGTYGMSDLTGCGLLTSFISPLTKGAGNTIDLTLTPQVGGAPAAS